MQKGQRSHLWTWTYTHQWPPLICMEIDLLVKQLKCGKTTKYSHIATKAIKNNREWWASILTSFFSFINHTACVLKDWKAAVLIPTFYKVEEKLLPNCRPISLLSIVRKLYARHLYGWLVVWMESENILAKQQFGFHPGFLFYTQPLYQTIWQKNKPNLSLYATAVDF